MLDLQALMNEIRERTTEQIIGTYLPRDKKGKGFVCPECNNGTGTTGAGIHLTKSGNYKGTFFCGSSRHTGKNPIDLVDIIQLTRGLEFKEALDQACSDTGIDKNFYISEKRPSKYDRRQKKTNEAYNYKGNGKSSEYEQMSGNIKGPTQKRQEPTNQNKVIDLFKDKTGIYFNLIKEAQNNIDHPKAKAYLKSRGISQETAKKHGLGYFEYKEYSAVIADTDGEKEITKKIIDAILFPTSENTFTLRPINKGTHEANKYLKSSDKRVLDKYGVNDIPFMLKEFLNNEEETSKKLDNLNVYEPVYLVEGPFDSLSLAQAGATAIALNGTGNINTIIAAFKEYEIKRPIILVLDADKYDNKNVLENEQKFIKELNEAGLKAKPKDFISKELYKQGVKDINDLLIYNESAVPEILNILNFSFVESFLNTFNRAKKDQYINRVYLSPEKIPTGFKILDSFKFLDGGLDEGLTVIGALSSLGKTAFTLQVADQIATAGHDVIFFSLEMSANELRDRSISRYSVKEFIENDYMHDKELYAKYNNTGRPLAKTQNQVKRHVFVDDNVSDKERDHIINSINSYFNDTGNHLRIIEGIGMFDAESVNRAVKEHIRVTGRKPIVFIDYLQLLQAPKDEKGQRRNLTDKQKTDENVLRLNQICRENGIPIFAISSLNRDSYNDEISLKSFKESGAIEYGTNVLIGLQRVNINDKDQLKKDIEKEKETGIKHLELKILKNRNGQAGGSVLFDFHCKYNFFVELNLEAKQSNSARGYTTV